MENYYLNMTYNTNTQEKAGHDNSLELIAVSIVHASLLRLYGLFYTSHFSRVECNPNNRY